MKNLNKFFRYARERHDIYLRRAAGAERPYTKDPILQKYRFCNVYRELDRTTQWMAKYVRPQANAEMEVLACVTFRMFNRIATGEAIFCQNSLDPKSGSMATAFERFADTGKVSHLRQAITAFVGKKGPYVTGSYIISTPPGYSKLDGVLEILRLFHKNSCWDQEDAYTAMEETFKWLSSQPWLGVFHSYEIVCDLRYCKMWFDGQKPSGAMQWCNVGPGARRGLNRILGVDKDTRQKVPFMLDKMREILDASRGSGNWPHKPSWEMREVEHTLCEFDKFERVRLGEGRPRGVFA
jgi:hypothetical protein